MIEVFQDVIMLALGLSALLNTLAIRAHMREAHR